MDISYQEVYWWGICTMRRHSPTHTDPSITMWFLYFWVRGLLGVVA